ncbi:MAG: hypothetical protein JRE64_20370 [Deltaproteobacteria bacterium]|nr:hypothetical protein [Deltaproteobacteria bacterium]
MEEATIVWTEYMKYRLSLRGYDLATGRLTAYGTFLDMLITAYGTAYGTFLDMLITYFSIVLICFLLQFFHRGLRIGLL